MDRLEFSLAGRNELLNQVATVDQWIKTRTTDHETYDGLLYAFENIDVFVNFEGPFPGVIPLIGPD